MDTRTKILETAARLFSKHGYESTSLSLVARDASVSKALIFWHFESKEHLYAAVLTHAIEPYSIDNEDLEGLGEPEMLRQLFDRYLEFVTQNVTSVRFFLGLFLRQERRPDDLASRILELHDHYCQAIADVIERGQKQGTLSAEVDPRPYAALAMSSLNGILLERFMGGRDRPSPERLVAELKAALIDRLQVQ